MLCCSVIWRMLCGMLCGICYVTILHVTFNVIWQCDVSFEFRRGQVGLVVSSVRGGEGDKRAGESVSHGNLVGGDGMGILSEGTINVW